MAESLPYAPTTFEDRGVAVAFTTPLLAQTRVRRDDRQRLEVAISSFTEGHAIYIVPWRSIPDVTAMTAHDRFLHMLIAKTNASTPETVRAAMLRAARSGLAGPKSAEMARQTLAGDDSDRTLANFLLTVEVLQAGGIDTTALFRAGIDSELARQTARSHLNRFAATLGIDAAILFRRVAEMADIVAPIGLAKAPRAGRLRQRLAEIDAFARSLRDWSEGDPTEAADLGRFCARVAADTAELGQILIDDFDRRAETVGKVIRDWPRQGTAIGAVARRLSWMVDGWDHLVTVWGATRDGANADRRAVVSDLFRDLPLIPRAECADLEARAAAAGDDKEVVSRYRRSVRAFEDWRTGRLDRTAVRRLEDLKRKALETQAGEA